MRIATLAIVLLGVSITSAATITWTGGAGNGLWSFPANWQGNVIPGASDDVIINPVGGVSVTSSQPAFANSITLGNSTGSSFAQTLILLSSMTVQTILIYSKATLTLQSNNDLPLTAYSNVTAMAGGAIIFNSGDITGNGSYVINQGATLTFAGTALKLIDGTDLINYGIATIQPTTIQIANGGVIHNRGELTAIGTVNIFYNDKSAVSFYNYGNFTYQGSGSSTLTFQVPTFLTTDLDIEGGNLILNERFFSTAAVNVPYGSTVTVNSGTTQKIFGAVTGDGTLLVQGLASFSGALTISTVSIGNSGELVLSKSATAKTATIGGNLVINTGIVFTVGDVSFAAGTVAGSGTLVGTGNFEITGSSNGDSDNFISAIVNVTGNGYTTGPISLLFSGSGALNVAAQAVLKITATTHFLKQSGSPVVNNFGTLTLVLGSGSTFYSNIDHFGTGTLSVVSGLVTFEADKLTTGPINIGLDALVTISAVIVNAGDVSGTGAINVTAVPSPTSIFGDVSVAYFGVPNGFVQVNSLVANTLEVFSGELHFVAGSANKATLFNWYGGALRGSATIVSSTVKLQGSVAQVLDAIVLTTQKLSILSGTNSMLTLLNGAQLIAGN